MTTVPKNYHVLAWLGLTHYTPLRAIIRNKMRSPNYFNLDILQLVFSDTRNLSSPYVGISRALYWLLHRLRQNLTIQTIWFICLEGLHGESQQLSQHLIWRLTSHRFTGSYRLCPMSQSIRQSMLRLRPCTLTGWCPRHSASNLGNGSWSHILAYWSSSACHVWGKSWCRCVYLHLTSLVNMVKNNWHLF